MVFDQVDVHSVVEREDLWHRQMNLRQRSGRWRTLAPVLRSFKRCRIWLLDLHTRIGVRRAAWHIVRNLLALNGSHDNALRIDEVRLRQLAYGSHRHMLE